MSSASVHLSGFHKEARCFIFSPPIVNNILITIIAIAEFLRNALRLQSIL